MLSAQILDSHATVNSFEVIESLNFIPGEETTLVLRLYQPQRRDKLRWVAGATATLTLHIPQADGTELELAATPMVGDFSIWSVLLTEAQTAEFIGGNFTFELVEGTVTTLGYVQNGLSLINTGVC
jgi:hypothetical protein